MELSHLTQKLFILLMLIFSFCNASAEEYVKGDDWRPALHNTEIMVLADGYAIAGYDPVAYFELGMAQKGNPKNVVQWRGAKWLFISEKHKKMFIESPENYAPQYGGWCAYGMSGHGEKGYGAQSRPQDSWSIIDNKLYFNWSPKVVKWWLEDKEQHISNGDKYWLDVKKGISTGKERVHWQDKPKP